MFLATFSLLNLTNYNTYYIKKLQKGDRNTRTYMYIYKLIDTAFGISGFSCSINKERYSSRALSAIATATPMYSYQINYGY